MSLDADARAQAVCQALIDANETLPKLSADEQASVKAAMLANVKAMLGADLTYLMANTVVSVTTDSTVLPGTIVTTGSPATQSGPPAPLDVSGTGTGTIS